MTRTKQSAIRGFYEWLCTVVFSLAGLWLVSRTRKSA